MVKMPNLAVVVVVVAVSSLLLPAFLQWLLHCMLIDNIYFY